MLLRRSINNTSGETSPPLTSSLSNSNGSVKFSVSALKEDLGSLTPDGQTSGEREGTGTSNSHSGGHIDQGSRKGIQ